MPGALLARHRHSLSSLETTGRFCVEQEEFIDGGVAGEETEVGIHCFSVDGEAFVVQGGV